MFNVIRDGIRQLIFPDNCFLCKTFLNSNHSEQLCLPCKSQLSPNAPPFCGRCSLHLDHFNVDSLCDSCRGSALNIDRMWGCYRYNDALSKLIYAFKYNGKTALHKTFTRMMVEFINTYHVPVQDFDLIAPIAIHDVRLRERGYNQAELLSLGISTHWAIAHEPKLLIRQKPTLSQTQLTQKQRFTNMQGAFKMNASKSVADKRVLLVDDLLTTKATANAAATALKEADAAYVSIITLAIA